jgi:hypothetical protein
MFVKLGSFDTSEKQQIVSAFYIVLTPILNHFIFRMRNEEVVGTLGKYPVFKKNI